MRCNLRPRQLIPGAYSRLRAGPRFRACPAGSKPGPGGHRTSGHLRMEAEQRPGVAVRDECAFVVAEARRRHVQLVEAPSAESETGDPGGGRPHDGFEVTAGPVP